MGVLAKTAASEPGRTGPTIMPGVNLGKNAPRDAASGSSKAAVEAGDLSLWYAPGPQGDHALHSGTSDHRHHRALGLREVHAAPLLQPHERPLPAGAIRGIDPFRRDRCSPGRN